MKKTSKCNLLIRKESKMKKYLFLAAALIAMGCGMTSCSNEVDVTEQTEQAPKLTKLVFTVAQEPQTRVAWGGENGRTPVFEEGDKVSLFSEHNANVMLTAHVADGVVTLVGEGTSGDADLCFVYPYTEESNMWDGVINGPYGWGNNNNPFYLNAMDVNASIDKFPTGALSMAKSTDGGASAITFQCLMTIFKFTPTQDYEEGRINIYANDDVISASHLTIDVENSKISDDCYKTSSIRMGYEFEEGHTYYFAVPPFAMSENDWIFLTSDDGNYIMFEGAKTFEAGKIYNLTAKEEM